MFPFAVYDIETEGIGSLDFALVGFWDGERYSCFYDLGKFFDHVLQPKYHGWRIFGHWGGRFDVAFLFDYIRRQLPETVFNFHCSGSCVISFKVQAAGLEWTFTDSGRLLPVKLETLGIEFDTPHKKLPFAPLDPLYNEHDCRCLYEVLTAFFGVHGICSETIASHAMRVYRTKFMDSELVIPHPDVEEFVRSSYCGGRCEVIRWDKAPVSLYDFNSMYPWAMLGPIPVEYLTRTTEIPDDDEEAIGFFECDIDYPEETYLPALPVHIDKLYFPVGKFRGVFTSMELRQAIEDGAGVTVRRGCIFRTERIFDRYVADLYTMKREAEGAGNGGLRLVAKLLLNSLYGKFGQRRRRRSYCFDPGTPYLYEDKGPRIYPLEHSPGIAWYWTDSQSRHILPHIAATVTARARLKLLGLMRRAGRVWYTDTDSVFTDTPLETGADLGEVSLQGSGDFEAFGLKEYRFGGKIKLKGVPLTVTNPDGTKTEDYTLANRYLERQPIEYKRMVGMLESVRMGESPLRFKTVTRIKRDVREKRVRSGPYDTRPWAYAELVEAITNKGRGRARAPSLLAVLDRLGGVRGSALLVPGPWDPRRGRYGTKVSGEWEHVPRHIIRRLSKGRTGNYPEELPGILQAEGFYGLNTLQDVIDALASPQDRIKSAGKFSKEEYGEVDFDPYFLGMEE